MNWINKDLQEIPISRMNDGYLYNTVKMIWNNTFGKPVPFGNVIQWDFSYPHTPAFLLSFFEIGFAELKKRDVEAAKKFIEHIESHGGKLMSGWLEFETQEQFAIDPLDFGDRD